MVEFLGKVKPFESIILGWNLYIEKNAASDKVYLTKRRLRIKLK